MIEQVVPSGVASMETFADPPDIAPMPGEEAIIARAVDKRRREFITARDCARKAMAQLGVEPAPILRSPTGSPQEKAAPIWPQGIVGSITHTDGYRAAVVAYKLQIRSLGIDAEPHEALPEGVLDHTSIAEERAVLATRPAGLHWDRLLFCAKEATFKTWFPLTKRWLGFEDAHITFEQTGEQSGTFVSKLLVDGSVIDGGTPLASFDGVWRVEQGFILTSIALT
ncbi:MAG: 4'-phosphopantetheinyl transferase superfamily protein [Gordonia amarae]